MRFTQMRSQLEQSVAVEIPDYQLKYLATEVRNLMQSIGDRYVEHLTADIVQKENIPDYKDYLGSSSYAHSNGFAREAISVCPYAREIYGMKIRSWTDHTLKCYDNLLIHFIQHTLGEKIYKQRTDVYETDVYQHLIKKGGQLAEIGEQFNFIYQIRSRFQHVQVEDFNGIRKVRTMSNKEYNRSRDMIIQWFQYTLALIHERLLDSPLKDKS